MANTADNQARDDAPSAAVGEGAMGQLYWESGGARAEKVNIDKAVELKILDETKAALLLGSAIEDDFKRAYTAEKASRKPTFEAFKAAFTAVYGKLRFEKPALSEKADGKKKSPLVAVMARVLKNNEGLTGDGANFDGHDALRVMACAMDDMSLAHREAQERVPGLRKKKAEQTRLRDDDIKPKQAKLEAARVGHKDLLENLDPSVLAGTLQKGQSALVDAKEKRKGALAKQAEVDKVAEDAKVEAMRALKQIQNLQILLKRFAEALGLAGHSAYKEVVDDFEKKVARFVGTDLDSFNAKGWQLRMDDDFVEVIKYFEKTPLIKAGATDAADKIEVESEDVQRLQALFAEFKIAHSQLSLIPSKVVTASNMAFAAKNQAQIVREAEADVVAKERALEATEAESDVYFAKLIEVIGKIENDPEVEALLPEVKSDCKAFLKVDHLNHGDFDAAILKLLQVTVPNLLGSIRSKFDALSAEQASKLKEVQDELKAIDKDLARLEVDRPKLTEGLKAVSSFAGKLGDEKIKGREAKGDLGALVPAAPKIAEAAEKYIAKADEFSEKLKKDSSVNMDQIVDFAKTVTVPFLENLKRELAALNEDERDAVLEVIGGANSIDGQLAEVKMLIDSSGDPEKRVLEAVFHGMKIGDDGEISVHGFKGSTSRVMEKFDGKRDKAGNVIEVGAIPWFADSKNLGGVEKEMAELGGLVDTMESEQFVLLLRDNGIDVQGNVGNLQFPSVSKMRGKLEEIVTALRGNVPADPGDRVIAAGVEKARVRFEADKERSVSAARAEWESVKDLKFDRRAVRREIRDSEQMNFEKNDKRNRLNKNRMGRGAWETEQKFNQEKAEKEKALRDEEAKIFDEGAAAEAIVGPAQKRRSVQVEKLGELGEALKILKKIEELTAKLEPKCKELVAHLGVGNTADVFGKAGLKFKKAGGDAQFSEVEAAAGALDAGKPRSFLAFYEMLKGERDGKEIGFFTDENKVEALVGEYKRVRASILEMTSKESPETAKRVVEEMLAQQGVPPEQINDVATAIIRDGVGIIATKKKWEQIAKECQPKALENLKALAFRDKLSMFKVDKGGTKSTPFASLKPENFADQAATEKTLKNLERTKGADWLLEYGFIIMAAFKVFEGNSQVEASGQGVVIEKYLKNMLAEKRLEQHPEFDSVDKAMMDSDFVKLINEEFEKRLERGAARFGEFSDAYDASAQGMKMKLALKLDRDIKILKAKRAAKTIGVQQYKEEFTAILEKAEEEGVRGMLKEVGARRKASTAVALSGMWNSDFMLGVRGVRKSAADWLKTKSKVLGLNTLGGIIKGGWEGMKRLTWGSTVASFGTMFYGIPRWTGSAIANFFTGHWLFKSTGAMMYGDAVKMKNYAAGGVSKAFTDATTYTKGMVDKVMQAKPDDAKAKRKEKEEQKLKLAESDTEALKGKTELDAVEVPAEPDKDIVSFFEKKHAALAERKKPASMRQERPSGQQERLAA